MGKSGQGKPQKSSKNKKIKAIDPFYTGNRGANRNTNVINQRPKNDDDQEVPRRVRELQRQIQLAKKPKEKKEKKKDPDTSKNGQDDKNQDTEQPTRKPRKGESDFSYMKRLDRKLKHEIARVKLEEKFGVDLEITEQGDVVYQKKPKSEKKKERLKKRKEKKQQKLKMKKLDRKQDFNNLKDEVEFGEVAMQPPSLTSKPRKSQDSSQKKAGVKSLLLAEIMRENQAQGHGVAPFKRDIGKSLKRKLMSPAQQVAMDAERQRAVELYRNIKAKKMKMNT